MTFGDKISARLVSVEIFMQFTGFAIAQHINLPFLYLQDTL